MAAGVRRAGAGGPPAVHEELAEIPRARLDLRQMDRPQIALALLPAGDPPPAAEDRHRPALGIWRDPQMVQKLELTAEQVKQVRNADFTFREKRLGLKAQLDSLQLQMDKAFTDDVIDDTAVLSLAEKISGVKRKLFIQKIEARLEVGKLLNADQINKLELHDMQPKKQVRKHGKK